MAERDPQYYGGETVTPYIVLSRVKLTGDSVEEIAFETFVSQTAFIAGDAPIPRLHFSFQPEAEEIEPYADVVDSIRNKALDVLGVGGRGFTLVKFDIDTVNKSMSIVADNGKGRVPNVLITPPEYDDTIQENLPLVSEALTVGKAIAKARDPYLAAAQ